MRNTHIVISFLFGHGGCGAVVGTRSFFAVDDHGDCGRRRSLVVVFLRGRVVERINKLKEFIVEVVPLLWIDSGEGGVAVVEDQGGKTTEASVSIVVVECCCGRRGIRRNVT